MNLPPDIRAVNAQLAFFLVVGGFCRGARRAPGVEGRGENGDGAKRSPVRGRSSVGVPTGGIHMVDARETALAVVARCRVVTLATTGPDGPWASPVFYTPDEFTLTFVSSPRSRHARNLDRDPRCAAAIHPDQSDWRSIVGVQMAGRVEELRGASRSRAVARYLGRFPFLDAADTPQMLRRALAGITWYRFVPESVHLVDNARGFGRTAIPLRTDPS